MAQLGQTEPLRRDDLERVGGLINPEMLEIRSLH